MWYVIDCPGSWHDGYLFDRSSDFIGGLPPGCWILGDTAFPRIPGKLERCRKQGENLPHDENRASFQLALEAWCRKSRLSSEWGIKDIRNVWQVLKKELVSDDTFMRVGVWEAGLKLNNFRKRTMGVGQMGTVFQNDSVEY